MENITVNCMGKTIPVTFNKRQNTIKLYNKWDEFFVLSHPKYTVKTVEKFVNKNQPWMKKVLNHYKDQIDQFKGIIQRNNIELETHTKEELRSYLNKYVDKYSYKGKVGKIYIRSDMNRSWATHSINHNLTFNETLKYVPKELIEYNVFHEMCHFEEWDHTKRFYELMEEKYPNYKEYDLLLKTYSYLILHKVTYDNYNQD